MLKYKYKCKVGEDMKKVGKTILIIIIKLTIFCLVLAGILYLVYTIMSRSDYDTSIGYIDGLDDLNDLYVEEYREKAIHDDMIEFGFTQTAPNRFEKAFNASLCEVFIMEEDSYTYLVTDTCYSVMEQKIVRDFNNDGMDVLFYYSPGNGNAFLRESTADKASYIEYNPETKTSVVTGAKIDEIKIQRFYRGYEFLIDKFNAKAF